MCRLFGLISDVETKIEFSFFNAKKPFLDFSKTNHDGWGVGWYMNGHPEIFKQGLNEIKGKEYAFSFVKLVRSHAIISHMRKATQGIANDFNAHPFTFENFIFAHNGHIERADILPKLDKKYWKYLEGDTDSEVYFMILMQEIKKNGLVEGIKAGLEIVRAAENSGLNFLLATGKEFFAFRESSKPKKHTLFYLEKGPKFEHLSQKTYQRINHLPVDYKNSVLFCSEPLTDDVWHEIKEGELVCINQKLELSRLQI